MTKKTISEAITAALTEAGKPMTSAEIYIRIKEKNYYQFKAKNPAAIVSGEIRKRSAGSKTLTGKPVYKKNATGSYSLIENSK